MNEAQIDEGLKRLGDRADAGLSVVVPVYNERDQVVETITRLRQILGATPLAFEIIAVDDGSADGTAELLDGVAGDGVVVIHHRRNRGYGASLKTGVRRARFPFVAITDADGTYPNERLPELLVKLDGYDMVVGARIGQKVRIPLIRRPAKWFIRRLASYLSGVSIPDLNSGLRVFNKPALMKYLHLLPQGFSFTTTITLCMLTAGHDVRYESIDYAQRVGQSKIRPIRDTLNFIGLIIRTVLLFEPMRVFVPLSVVHFLLGVAVGVWSYLYTPKFMDMTVAVLAVASMQMLAIGMLADMVNRRMGPKT